MVAQMRDCRCNMIPVNKGHYSPKLGQILAQIQMAPKIQDSRVGNFWVRYVI